MNKVANRFTLTLPPTFLLILFWSVCFYGIDFGSHWDERRAKLDSVKKSVESGIFMQSVNEPDGFSYNYGGVNYLLTWAGFAPELARYVWNGPHTREALAATIGPLIDTQTILLRSRAIFAFVSSLSIVWLYCLIRVLDRNRTEAFFAAAILSLSWEVGYHSRWNAPDAVMMQFTVLAFLCAAIAMKRSAIGWYYGGAIVTGLAVGTKYTGGFVLPFLLIGATYTLWQKRSSVAYMLKHVAGLAAATALSFISTTPGAVLDPFRFVEQLQTQGNLYAFGFFGYSIHGGLRHFVEILKYFMLQGFSHYWAISIVLTAFCLLGLIVAVKERRLITLSMVGFCLVYVVFFAQQKVMIVRNMLVIFPFLSLAAARGITAVSQRLGKTSTGVLYAVIGLGLVVNLGWEVFAAGQIGKRSDLNYFARKFEAYAKASPGDTFLVSESLFVLLNRLDNTVPSNITTKPDALYTKVAFLQSNGPDKFLEWPANKWDTYDTTFGGMEVNLEAYPTFTGNERILVVSRKNFGRLPMTVEDLSHPAP